MLTTRLVRCVLIFCFAYTSGWAATPIFAARASAERTTISPDGKSVVTLRLLDDNANDFPTEVSVRTSHGTLISTIRFGLNPEILWSGDSRAFSVTGSCCGGIGQYQTDVFFIGPQKLSPVALTSFVERVFGHPVKCGWPESPNVAGIKWLDGSKMILVTAEVLPHSNCDSFGTFKGYVIDLHKKQVVKTYNQLELKRRFASDLGPELKEAEDSCVRDPKSCYVSSNHTKLTNSTTQK